MAGLSHTRTDGTINGKTQSEGAAGRRLSLTSFSKSDMSQAEIDSVVQAVQLTASVTAIGSDQSTVNAAILPGTTDVIYVLSEGIAPTAGSNFGGVTGVTAAVVCYFDQR